MGTYASNWCFTINNYSDEDETRLRELSRHDNTLYLIYGREIGENGTPHLQGFVRFKSRCHFNRCKVLVSERAHLEISRNASASAKYCKKDGSFEEFGSLDVGKRGTRNDLEEFKETVKSGVRDLKVLRELHSEVCAKYPKFVTDYLVDNSPAPPVKIHLLRDWQMNLNHMLNGEPSDREIIFVVDVEGNKGKTWFAKYYCSLHPRAQILIPGKKVDMSYVLRTDVRVVFLDAPRSKQGEFIQYDFLEEIKNGYVAAYKYESRVKILPVAHVVVLMNESPDFTKLSVDRYKVVNI